MAARSSSRPFDAGRLDAAAFAAADGLLEGAWPLAALDRLAASEAPEAAGAEDRPVRYRLAGVRREMPAQGRLPALRIEAAATVVLACQRCLQPLEVPLVVDRTLLFVEGEDRAADLDAESDDDVLALEPAIDARALVEDELLLALPIVPRHEVCPEPLPAVRADDVEEPEEHPFAALAALRKR